MILIGSGPWSYLDEEVAIASSNLALITGHVGRESCGVIFLLEKCNSQGSIDMGVFPENEDGGMKAFLGRAGEGNLKALYLVGEDTAVSSPAWRQALEKVSLLIVQDLFMTETARMAHVVLPACSFVEKTGTFTSLERRVQELNPLRPPRGQAKSDFDIFLQLLGLLGTPFQTEAEEDVFEKIGRLVPFYRGIQDGGQWPGNSPFLYAGGFPNGKARLIPVEGKRADRDGDFPFQMVQRPSLFQSGLLSSRSDALKRVSERPCLEISAEDARLLKIEEGEVVRVSTREGGSLEVEAKYSSLVSPWVLTVLYPCSLLGERSVVSVQIDR
jgi:formate dehydrogenase major subunit/NADH-quinone oxidoreductase subunit G